VYGDIMITLHTVTAGISSLLASKQRSGQQWHNDKEMYAVNN
jgi:hypothetical protein